MVFLSVNTLTKHRGHSAESAADLAFIKKAAHQIALSAQTNTIVMEQSTLPMWMIIVLTSSPFWIMAGRTAIEDLQNLDRVLGGIFGKWVDDEQIINTNLWLAEFAKLTSKAPLGQQISSTHAAACLCKAVGADVEEVHSAIGAIEVVARYWRLVMDLNG